MLALYSSKICPKRFPNMILRRPYKVFRDGKRLLCLILLERLILVGIVG
jgi:hypothetical protein